MNLECSGSECPWLRGEMQESIGVGYLNDWKEFRKYLLTDEGFA